MERGVKAGALAACVEKVGFLPGAGGTPAGVKEGESTLSVLLDLASKGAVST